VRLSIDRCDPSLAASVDRVDLWLASSKASEALLAQYRTLLSDEEKSQEFRFYFESDRRRYLVTRALVRSVLSRYSNTPPSEWRFVKDSFGRPLVANDGEIEKELSFNVSHASNLILMGVTRESPLGVDIEFVRHHPEAFQQIAQQWFSGEEATSLKALPPDRQVPGFFEYWTLKESYAKARGVGLSMPFNSFRFNLSADTRIDFVVALPWGDEGADWRFWQLRPLPGYIAAVCVRRQPQITQALSLCQAVVLGRDEPLEWSVLRQSM
jgi:4'-phosphopantetheinyl transferase